MGRLWETFDDEIRHDTFDVIRDMLRRMQVERSAPFRHGRALVRFFASKGFVPTDAEFQMLLETWFETLGLVSSEEKRRACVEVGLQLFLEYPDRFVATLAAQRVVKLMVVWPTRRVRAYFDAEYEAFYDERRQQQQVPREPPWSWFAERYLSPDMLSNFAEPGGQAVFLENLRYSVDRTPTEEEVGIYFRILARVFQISYE
jgi:hypothetical protein